MIGCAILALLLLPSPTAAAGREDAASTEIVPQRDFPKGVREAPQQDDTHRVVRWMIKPLRRGMFIRLPVIDTDPNRGVTGGIMPIWVLQGEKDDRIEQIHAPSLTYNQHFKLIPTYRYYYYPQEDANLIVLASWSQYEREAMGEYSDSSTFGTEHDIFLRVNYTVDAGQRFYGFGPNSAQSSETNYKEDYVQYRWGVGTSLVKDGNWRARLSQHYQSGRILNGPLADLTKFSVAFPNQFSDVRQQATESRVTLGYDDRDHGVTTGRGTFFETFAEVSRRGALSSYNYERYGADYRWFKPWATDKVLAVQAKYEQLIGPAPPFWLMPRLGGKYSLRSYGAGRYTDRAVAVVNVEQRFKMFEKKVGGVTTEFQIAPFVGAGTVFDNPHRAAAKYVRPTVGAALRAVAKPQVVGSLDFGVGREGIAVFMDINYSF